MRTAVTHANTLLSLLTSCTTQSTLPEGFKDVPPPSTVGQLRVSSIVRSALVRVLTGVGLTTSLSQPL